jgi:hypothetical protein
MFRGDPLVRSVGSVSVYGPGTECWHWARHGTARHSVGTQQLLHWNTKHYDELVFATALRRSSSVSVVTAERVRSGQDIVCTPIALSAHMMFHLFGTRGLFPRGCQITYI